MQEHPFLAELSVFSERVQDGIFRNAVTYEFITCTRRPGCGPGCCSVGAAVKTSYKRTVNDLRGSPDQ